MKKKEETGMHPVVLFCNIATKRVEKLRYAFYRTRIKPVLQQMNEYWLLIDEITPESRPTRELRNVFLKKFVWHGKTRNMYRFCGKKYNYSLPSASNVRFLQQPDLLQDGFERG